MRWFKHYSDNYRGRSVGRFYKEFGHSGISMYYLLTEICTEKMESLPNRGLEQTDFIFSFDLTFVRSVLRSNLTKIESFLSLGSTLNLWDFKIVEQELNLKYPILLDLFDSDLMLSRSRCVRVARKQRLEIELEKEIELELEKDIILDRAAKTETPETKEIAIKRQNKSVSKQAPVQLKTMQDFYNCVGPEICESWFNIYKSKEFIEKEVLKSFSWLLANPNKATRSPRGWKQFYTNWFSKAIDSQAKTGLSNKPSKLDIDNINLTEVKR